MAPPHFRGMVESEQCLATQLEEEYSSLDPPLIRAILSDFDITNPDQLKTARDYLDILRASATTDDAVLFDPSGTSGSADVDSSPEARTKREKSSDESTTSVSGDTDCTSISHGLSSLDLSTTDEGPSDSNRVLDDLCRLDMDDKVAHLAELFPMEDPSDISQLLREESNGDFVRALDVLLNHSFFNDAAANDADVKVLHKGVDGFASANIASKAKKRKGKGKGRKFQGLDDGQSPTSPDVPQIIPQYAPLKLSETSDSPSSESAATHAHTVSSAKLAAARSMAFSQASDYHRKGRSDHLMGAAAAYYSSLGRDYHSALQASSAAEADRLVAAQSSATQLDLHGVSVKDGTRIASVRVRNWWHGQGENRIKGAGRPGPGRYTIITGIGRHSDGGVGKLGPAVTKMLLKDGWKVEIAGFNLPDRIPVMNKEDAASDVTAPQVADDAFYAVVSILLAGQRKPRETSDLSHGDGDYRIMMPGVYVKSGPTVRPPGFS